MPASGTISTENLPADLAAFLEGDPWEPRWEKKGRPVETFWSSDLEASRSQLWPFLADTTGLNERLGLAEMHFEERDGRLFGKTGGANFRQEWVEIPWEWESGRQISAERIYSKGFAKAVRIRFLLADTEGGGTRLAIYMGWIPRGWWSRPLLRFINRWLRKQYGRVLRELDREVEEGVQPPDSRSETIIKAEVDEGRLGRGIDELGKLNFGDDHENRLASYIRLASDRDLFRIRPRVLAAGWGVDLRELLSLLLHATRAGLLRLSWDVVCPHCRGVRTEARTLGEIREFDRCDVCDLDFSSTAMDAIEVTFRVHPEVRKVREVFFCSAEPAKKPHIRIQRRLDPGEGCETEIDLPPGRYRLRAAGDQELGDPLSFEVSDSGGSDSLRWDPATQAGEFPALVKERLHLYLVNSGPEQVSVVLEDVAADSLALRPPELFNFQEFRDLFSEESIASGLNLEVGQQTILFTDLVGSSQLYSRFGDAEAFRMVRSHFVELHDVVGSHGGAVVKTIGDAMMAGFSGPEDALRAAVEIQRRFRPGGETGLTLRVSVHRGVCIAVQLDANIDYFGNAVNHTAKMLAVADAGQIMLSDEYHDLPGIVRMVEQGGLRLEETSFAFPAASVQHKAFRASLV